MFFFVFLQVDNHEMSEDDISIDECVGALAELSDVCPVMCSGLMVDACKQATKMHTSCRLWRTGINDLLFIFCGCQICRKHWSSIVRMNGDLAWPLPVLLVEATVDDMPESDDNQAHVTHKIEAVISAIHNGHVEY